jgi:YD repeat-containing protein
VASKDPTADPINPGVGNVYKREEDDVAVGGDSPIAFQRFYNSADPAGADMGPAWRHSYDRSIAISHQPSKMSIYPGQSATVSAIYSTPSDACQSGFASIQSQINGWQSATATYTNNACVISTSGGTLGTLQVHSQYIAPSVSTAVEYDVVQDDGQTLRYTNQGGAITAPPGVSLQLTQTASGFTVTDDQDNVETYNANGVLQSIRSRAGMVQTMAYDSNGRLSTVTDSVGNVLTLGRAATGQVGSVSINSGTSVRFSYDAQLRLGTVTKLDATTRTYVYGNAAFPMP